MLSKENTPIVSYHKKTEKKKLKQIAKKKNKSMSEIIATLVEEFNKKHETQK